VPLLLISVGSLFHSRGPATEKLLSPIRDLWSECFVANVTGATASQYWKIV